jgi:hypothetical protein
VGRRDLRNACCCWQTLIRPTLLATILVLLPFSALRACCTYRFVLRRFKNTYCWYAIRVTFMATELFGIATAPDWTSQYGLWVTDGWQIVVQATFVSYNRETTDVMIDIDA